VLPGRCRTFNLSKCRCQRGGLRRRTVEQALRLTRETVPATGRMLREVIETVGVQNVTVIGNSAGGGLSLAAAQWLREAGHPQPNALILIDSGA
jgi:pimeloyl-ACP methyl ester carboxylesterase